MMMRRRKGIPLDILYLLLHSRVVSAAADGSIKLPADVEEDEDGAVDQFGNIGLALIKVRYVCYVIMHIA